MPTRRSQGTGGLVIIVSYSHPSFMTFASASLQCLKCESTSRCFQPGESPCKTSRNPREGSLVAVLATQWSCRWGHPSLLTAMLIELIHSPWIHSRHADTLASSDPAQRTQTRVLLRLQSGSQWRFSSFVTSWYLSCLYILVWYIGFLIKSTVNQRNLIQKTRILSNVNGCIHKYRSQN